MVLTTNLNAQELELYKSQEKKIKQKIKIKVSKEEARIEKKLKLVKNAKLKLEEKYATKKKSLLEKEEKAKSNFNFDSKLELLKQKNFESNLFEQEKNLLEKEHAKYLQIVDELYSKRKQDLEDWYIEEKTNLDYINEDLELELQQLEKRIETILFQNFIKKYEKIDYQREINKKIKAYQPNNTNQNKELVYEAQKEVFYERKYAYFKPFWLVKQNFKNNIKTSYNNSIISLKDKFNKYKNYGLKDWMNFTIWKIPLYLWFVIIPVIGLMVGFFAWDENLPWFWNGKTAPNIMSKDMKTMAFGLGIMLVMAAIFGSFFGKLPIWKKYFGGAVIGCLVTGSLFVQFVPTFKKDQPMYQAVEAWFKTGDFLSFYISILLAGAVMTMNRKLILKSVTNFFVIITIGCIVAAVFVAVTALIIDYPIGAAINNVLFPAIADGNGGGVLPMSKIIDGIEAGKDGLTGKGGDWYTGAIAVSTLCSVLSIVMAALLSELGKSKPSLSGNGKLMIGQPRFFEKPGKIDYRNAAGTLLLICVLFMLSMVFEKLIFTTTLLSKITTIPGAHIPAFAWMVVFCLILNLSGLIPNKTKLAAKEINQFVVKQMTWMLMIGVGMISVHFEQFIKIFTQWQKIILCFAVVIGITIGTMAFAKLFNFFAIESALTAGLCMSAQGGSGVIGVLGASNRMELMAYGQLACRIMGSVVLLVAAPLFEVWKASLI